MQFVNWVTMSSMTGMLLVQQQTTNGCDMKRVETIPMQKPSLDTLLVMFSASINLISIAAMLPSLLFLEGNQRIGLHPVPLKHLTRCLRNRVQATS
jgi:hypothetical protein